MSIKRIKSVRLVVPPPGSATEEPQLPPGPRGHHLIGSLREVRRDRLAFIRNAFGTYGDLVAFRLGRRALYLVSNPDIARHVLMSNAENYRKGMGIEQAEPLFGAGLLSSDGAKWHEQRALLQQAFHPQHLERFAEVVLSETQSAIERWRSLVGSELNIDLSAEMAQLALNVVAKALLGVRLESSTTHIVKDLQVVGDWAMRRMTALLPLPAGARMVINIPVRRALGRINLLAREIADRIEQNRTSDAQDLTAVLGSIHHMGLSKEEAGRRIRDQIVTFLLAGHETTAATVSWVWYLLYTHPAVADLVRKELHQELGDRPPRCRDLARLTYTRTVIDETMRLYPPVWMITRRAIATDVLGSYRIAAGTDVLISIYSLHRRSDFWPEPETFEPQRFSKFIKRRANSPYWPFGIGPRACIASRFGIIEAMMIIACIVPRIRFKLVSQSLEPEPGLTLRPRGGLIARIEFCETVRRR